MIRNLEDKGFDPAGIKRRPASAIITGGEDVEAVVEAVADADVVPIRIRRDRPSKPTPDDKPGEAKPE